MTAVASAWHAASVRVRARVHVFLVLGLAACGGPARGAAAPVAPAPPAVPSGLAVDASANRMLEVPWSGLEPGPDGGARPPSGTDASSSNAPPPTPLVPPVSSDRRCPPDMVRVAPPGASPYCVDRYEASLVDDATGRSLSPFYAPNRDGAVKAYETWRKKRSEIGSRAAKKMGLPELPEWRRQETVKPRAQSVKGVLPNGHVSGTVAAQACRAAGKRLCTATEWRTACGGEAGHRHPYGPEYVQDRCNVFREAHPASVLHGNASIGHDDPRLNLVTVDGKPLLRKTGDTPSCTSRWGEDAIHDMVGNVDEWLDDEHGAFAGGFYSRATRKGCDWQTSAHVNGYQDYSTGVRCCADLP